MSELTLVDKIDVGHMDLSVSCRLQHKYPSKYGRRKVPDIMEGGRYLTLWKEEGRTTLKQRRNTSVSG